MENDDKTIIVETTDRTMRTSAASKPMKLVPNVQPLMGDEDKTKPTVNVSSVGAGGDNTQNVAPIISAGEVTFVLKGKSYKAVRSISESSGEAQIVLVERDGKNYCLKVYYPNFRFKDNILNAIWNINADMVMKLYDYGHTVVNGIERDYELMEYLEGGTLGQYELKGDVRKFRLIALQAAAALSACHSFGIIHKDIKPANFFFRDKEKTQVVLGDFGISSMVKEGEEMLRTSQARTPAFAAPEMYDDVIDGEVEIDCRADFYSLGITLLYLWLGKSPFTKNERLMIRMKQEGRLPHLDELPERVGMIIRGLTSLNPQRRWGYEEVERWFVGEDVPVDTSSMYLRYKSFMVDPDRNLAAHDLKELVPLLYDNPQLGIRYLYSNRLSAWLDECGNGKMAVLLNDIVEHRYPTCQEAGLAAALYAMEPNFPYYDVKGRPCKDSREIALSLLNNAKEYEYRLQNPLDTLFVYLDSHFNFNMDRLRAYFSPADNRSVLKLVYEIEPNVPFLPSVKCDTLQELVAAFASPDRTEDEWTSVTDGRLLAWLYSRADMSLCESVKLLTHFKQDNSRTTAYQVLYNIDRKCGYDFGDAKTMTRVATLMADKLHKCQNLSEEELANEMKDFLAIGGRLEIYARLHQWSHTLNAMNEILKLNAPNNTERYAMYDLRTAAYKLCKAMGGEPVYEIAGEEGSVIVSHPDQLEDLPVKDVRQAIRNGCLVQWMSVFFHEDPMINFDSPSAYNECVRTFLDTVGSYDAGEIHYKRFIKAQEEFDRKVVDSHRKWDKSLKNKNLFRFAFVGVNVLWIVMLIIFGLDETPNMKAHVYIYTMLSVGLPLGAMFAVKNYFHGNGFMLGLLNVFLGVLLSLIPALILSICHHNHPGTARWAALAMSACYMAVGLKFAFGKSTVATPSDELKDALKVNEENALSEMLYYTFRSRTFKFKGSTFAMMDDAVGEARSSSTEKVITCVMWGLLPACLCLAMLYYHSSMLDHTGPDVNSWKQACFDFWAQFKALF